MKHYTDCQDEYDVSVLLMPTCINGLKKLAESFNVTEEEYLLALGDLADCFFHYVNTDEAPKLKTPLSQIAFEFAKEQARQSANRYKTGKTNGKKGVEAKKQKADAKRAKEAAKLNTVKPEATEPEDNQPITNSDKLKNQTVSSSHQLQKTQQPQKPQQVQKMHELNWQCVAGLELTEHQQQEAVRIRKANNPGNSKEAKKIQTFTQASLKQFLTQVKYSVDAGISIDEVLEVWEGKQWRSWTHAYYAKERPSNAKPQGISGSQENISFAQSDAVDKSFDKLKSDINFLADNSDAPEGHTEEFTIEDLREIVTKEIQDRQYNKQQQQVLFNKLQAFLFTKYPDLARQVKPQQINADIKQIGAVNG